MAQDSVSFSPVLPHEGWHVLHLFYRINHGEWELLDNAEQRERLSALSALIAEIRTLPHTQLLLFSMVSPKADFGCMLLVPDLQVADDCAKRLGLALGPNILEPVFSWLSMTERSEYTTTDEEYARSLEIEERLKPGTAPFAEKMASFQERMAKYAKDRLEPNMPDWPVFCFYPMSKRRGTDGQNWYALPLSERKRLMAGHARVGRTYAGRIRQLITGSTGLDEGEWGVTLFAHTTSEIKAVVYEMRFDEVSAQFAEFGDFYIGLQLPLDILLRRLRLA